MIRHCFLKAVHVFLRINLFPLLNAVTYKLISISFDGLSTDNWTLIFTPILDLGLLAMISPPLVLVELATCHWFISSVLSINEVLFIILVELIELTILNLVLVVLHPFILITYSLIYHFLIHHLMLLNFLVLGHCRNNLSVHPCIDSIFIGSFWNLRYLALSQLMILSTCRNTKSIVGSNVVNVW